MQIDQRNLIQIQQVVDQENAGIAEVLECDEYLQLLWMALSTSIESLNKQVKDSTVSPEAKAIIAWNLIDLSTVLRLAQLKLAEFVLEQEEETTDD